MGWGRSLRLCFAFAVLGHAALLLPSASGVSATTTNRVFEDGGLWFPVGETINYNVIWGGIVVARTISSSEWIEEDGRRLIAIRFRTKSNRAISLIYPVDDLIESVIDPETFLPVRFTKNLREGRYRCHEVTTFDHELGVATLENRREETTRQYGIDDDTRDLVSFMYSMRTASFPVGSRQLFRVMADEKLYDLHVKALKRERIRLPRFGKVETVLLEPEATFEGLFVRKGKMKLWVSEDDRRLIAKASIKVPVASLVLKLIKVTGPGDDMWVRKSLEEEKRKPASPRRRRR